MSFEAQAACCLCPGPELGGGLRMLHLSFMVQWMIEKPEDFAEENFLESLCGEHKVEFAAALLKREVAR